MDPVIDPVTEAVTEAVTGTVTGTAADAPPLVTVRGLVKRFGERVALQGLDFEVRRGEVFALLGPNGCGKSTALAIVAGLLAPDAGSVLVEGAAPTASAAHASSIGLAPQEIALYRDLTPRENLEFFGRVHGLAGATLRQRVDALVERFGLGPHAGQRVATLSGGWQQRVNIAAALVHAPALLILDEPTAAVDVQARADLGALIGGLARDGLTLLLATHHLDEAERLCHRAALLRDGRVLAAGRIADLVATLPGRAVARVGTSDPEALRARAAALGWPLRAWGAPEAHSLLLPAPLALAEVLRALDGVPVSALAVQPVRLEHAYLERMSAGVIAA
jgi:ABC-2 type transport system ATP-binding protein